ncbi:MAG: hypothetical protein ACIARR_12145 [Phycisphaerales bacterium JB059]
MRSNKTSRGTSARTLIGGAGLRKRRPTQLRERCGVASRRERGSALLLVVGALALISVFAAVYVTIGQGDGRSATANELGRRVEGFGPIFGDYIAQTIADDRLDLELRLSFEDTGGPASGTWGGGPTTSLQARQVPHRENVDLPRTDWSVRSIPDRTVLPGGTPAGNAQRLAFNPTGTMDSAWSVSETTDIPSRLRELRLDRRVASDPWLASTEPTYLGDGTDRFSATGRFTSTLSGEKHRIEYLDKRDWAHISNLSPDGMFVNLYNLRGDAGGFDAEPGYTPGGFWVPGFSTPVPFSSVFGTNDDPENIPALWSTNQRFMLMPLNQSFFTYDRMGEIADWSSPDYPAYQYADADGDGLADSRWFELSDASGSTAFESVFQFLAPVEGYRLFGAARVVDLSALVNVNTATDGLVGPTRKSGWTPSSIDLRRILTMADQGREYRDYRRPTSKGLALGSIKRDARTGQGDIYADYAPYQLNSSLLGQVTPSPDEAWNAQAIGTFATDAIALAIETESNLSVGDIGRVSAPLGTLREVSRFELDQADPEREAALRLRSYYERVGSMDPTDPVGVGASDLGSGLFGITDLTELLTFWGINDDEINSRLEQVVFGRFDDRNSNLNRTTRRMSPLMTTRPTALDRARHDTLNQEFDPARPPETDGILDPDSMALRAVTPRTRITTFSGGADILSVALGDENLGTLGEFEAPARIDEFLIGLETGQTSASDVYEVFATALAGSASLDEAWDPAKPEFRTMFYGRQGPELALTLSSFLTANLIDAYDDNIEPTPLAVLALSSGSSAVEATEFDTTVGGGGAFPWPKDVKLGDIGDGLVPPEADEDELHRKAYTVYGLEAYPVLTEVASMVILTDASKNSGGDDESAGGGGPPWVPSGGDDSDVPGPITIRTDDWDDASAWTANEDLVLVALSFQLANPFDVPIELGSAEKGDGAVMDDDEYLFYFEFNGRLFKIADYDENANEYTNVVLDPGEARTFYVLANDGPDALGEIASKWTDLLQGYFPGQSVSEDDVVEWLNRQFQVTGNANSPVRIREFDALTGQPVDNSSNRYVNILKPAPTPALGRTAEDKVVRLWRRMELETPGGMSLASFTPEHDLLVDRLVEPGSSTGGGGGPGAPIEWSDGSATLVPVPANITSDEVASTLAGDEATASGNVAGGSNDNSGFTIVYTGSIRRGDHPGTNAVQPAGVTGRGVLPAWMIDSPTSSTVRFNSVPPRGNGSKLRKSDFEMIKDFAFDSFIDFLDKDDSRGVGPAVPSIAAHPNAKGGVADRTRLIAQNEEGDPFYAPAGNVAQTVLNPELPPSNKTIRENVTDPYSGVSELKALVSPTDLLLIPAVGWIETPDPTNPSNFDDTQWITFGEMLGHALGFNPDPGLPSGAPSPSDPLEYLVERPAIGGHRYVLDRLHLRLDDYVQFYDEDADGVYRANTGSLDVATDGGLPMAMDIVTRFRRFGPADAGEALTSKVMGRINLNTATLDTLRAVPMLSPSLETMFSGRREFWGFDPMSASPDNILGPTLLTPRETPDIAAHLIAYRDRTPATYRASSFDYQGTGVNIATSGSVPFQYLGLDENGTVWTDPVQAAAVMASNQRTSNLLAPASSASASETGRTVLTGIEGLREQQGFASPAEAVAAVADPVAVESLFGSGWFDQIRQNLATSYGIDTDAAGDPLAIESRSVAGDVVTVERQLYADQSDEIANDYEEQLAVLDAVLATTDVRSDTFAVWFVVHGYQESDVADLREDDPLVPSYARRFSLVEDRSNVTERGERPRIVMFREVPL